jgi:LacI family transcriptional regulator
MNDWRVAGTILMPVRSERGRGAATLRELGMQAVLADRVAADNRFDTVTADNREASAAVAEVLTAQGHAHVLVHGATRISKAVRLRMEGFAERAKALAPGARIDTLVSDQDLAAQRRAIHEYLAERGRAAWPTAVFSLTQHSTLIVLSELRRRSVQIPCEVALVGFDDVDWMQTTWPSITAVAQPVAAIATRAMEALLARVERGEDSAPAHYLEPCTLRVRQSCGPAEAAGAAQGHSATPA